MSRQFDLETADRSRRYGTLARAVTASAEAGGFSSQAVCAAAAKEIVEGIRLLGPCFTLEEVPVVLVGACGQSPAIRKGVARRLAADRGKRYRTVESKASPVVGAVWMALREEGLELREDQKRPTDAGGTPTPQ